MKYDIVLAGVGGQGVLSVSSVIALSAMKENLYVKQSEVHGMSQRGGAVQANLRLSDSPIDSDLIAKGSAYMMLSMEPMECLRYLKLMSVDGAIITSKNPVKNIPDYPDIDQLLGHLSSIPNTVVMDTDTMAKDAGSIRATNMVIIGASSLHLPIKKETLEESIRETFSRKGDKVVEINLKAFYSGREQGK